MEDNKKWINDIKVIDKLIHYSQIEKRNYYITLLKIALQHSEKKIKQCLFILFKILIFFNHLHVS